MQIDYQLAESVVTVAGTREIVVDDGGTPIEQVSLDATVTLGVRAERTWARQLRFGSAGTDDDFSATLTPDGRLTSISYKSTGVGAKVVGATITLAAVVAGLVTRGPAVATRSREQPRDAWAAANPDLAALRDRYRALTSRAAEQLIAGREAAVDDPARLIDTRRLAHLLADTREELARLDALRDAWYAARRSTRTERHAYQVALPTLPEQDGGAPPDPAALDERCQAIWTTLGVLVTVGPAQGRQGRPTPRHLPALDGDEQAVVRWRIPRPVRIWTWRPDAAGDPVLHGSTPAFVVDEHCDTAGIELDSRLFGDVRVQLEFDDLGAPSRIAHGDTSAAGTIADVLTAAPDRFGAGLTAVHTIGAALAEREVAGLDRRLRRARADLELAGIGATAAQHAELKRLEQQVLLGTARADLAGRPD